MRFEINVYLTHDPLEQSVLCGKSDPSGEKYFFLTQNFGLCILKYKYFARVSRFTDFEQTADCFSV